MERKELGERLCQWHSSMHDPIYAVGSFYFSGHVYPNKEIVEDAVRSITSTLNEQKAMLRGERVAVSRNCQMVDLKEFAGYDDDTLRTNIEDLEEIVGELSRFLKEDYA